MSRRDKTYFSTKERKSLEIYEFAPQLLVYRALRKKNATFFLISCLHQSIVEPIIFAISQWQIIRNLVINVCFTICKKSFAITNCKTDFLVFQVTKKIILQFAIDKRLFANGRAHICPSFLNIKLE